MSRILGDLSDILASGPSHNARNKLKFCESAPIMQFDQFHQITLSLSNNHFITFNDNHHFDDDGVIPLN